jgi:hypothetical protein
MSPHSVAINYRNSIFDVLFISIWVVAMLHCVVLSIYVSKVNPIS